MKIKIAINRFFPALFGMLLMTAGCNNSHKLTERGTLNPIAKFEPHEAVVYTTAKDSELKLSLTGNLSFIPSVQPKETEPFVYIDPNHEFQTFLGIGGAITDASAETFYKLPVQAQQRLLKAYYDPADGIGYTIVRTNINSCDFSSDSYTYVADNDSALATFDVKHDEQYKIPLIKQAMQMAGNNVKIYASPWSPPAWMKDNNSMLQGGRLLDKYRNSWANYYVKFVNAYRDKGIDIWGLTVQNEPMAKQTWESCIYSAEDERDFVKGFLGPTLVKSGMSSIKLVVWDHNRDLAYQRASVILNDPEAAKYVWGLGFHWYETWTGGGMQFDNIKRVKESFPDKELMFTEGTVEKFDLNKISDWGLGEKYAYSMVHDFNNGTVIWTDWNILLDQFGGPNHVGNYCFAPVHADTESGKLMFTNSYYYIGHFSKFIRPGAKRIAASSNREMLETTAFRNPNGQIVVVVLNRSDDAIPYKLMIGEKMASGNAAAHSIQTILLD